MSEDFTIRFATPADAEIIYSLVRHLADTTGQQHRFRSRVEDIIKYGFSDDPQFEALLAEQDGSVVGLCLYFYDFSSWRGQLGVYIQDLVVDGNARARGIGRALMREAARNGREHGATHLRLTVEQDNETAIRFYEKLGLKESSNERIYTAFDDDFLNLTDAT